jgi:RAT1-interacting protein
MVVRGNTLTSHCHGQEFACFSYDKDHKLRLDDSSLKWYYPPDLGVNLSNGFDKFIQHDDSVDEHLDSLLTTIANHEQKTGEPIDAHIVTWRGMMTKVWLGSPFLSIMAYADCHLR